MTDNTRMEINHILNLLSKLAPDRSYMNISELLHYQKRQTLGYVRDAMGRAYRISYTNRWEVPDAALWKPLELKTYDFVIPVYEELLHDLRCKRTKLHHELYE